MLRFNICDLGCTPILSIYLHSIRNIPYYEQIHIIPGSENCQETLKFV